VKVVVSGASGLIGSALLPLLRADGHDVVRLVRRPPTAADEVQWDPAAGEIDMAGLDGVEAAVHLSGAGVGDARWTARYKQKIRASRVDSTSTLSRALAELSPRPRVLVSASGVGWYGDTGDTPVDETGAPGSTFLASVVRDWEAATAPAEQAGVRVAHLRTGLVVADRGGAFGKLWPLFRLGLGGRLGSGRQWWSWVHIDDQVGACRFLLARDDIEGPVNVTAPTPVTNADLTKALGRAVRRPTPWIVPAPALRLGLGEFADELLISQRVLPGRLEKAGFDFAYPDIDSAAAAAAPGSR
jgi:hypothetical protein